MPISRTRNGRRVGADDGTESQIGRHRFKRLLERVYNQ